jgi:hypothetical protein
MITIMANTRAIFEAIENAVIAPFLLCLKQKKRNPQIHAALKNLSSLLSFLDRRKDLL